MWNNKINPDKIDSYLCRINNGYIKMCFWNGENWFDMWKNTLDGVVKEWMKIPYNEIETESENNKENQEEVKTFVHDSYWVDDEWIQPPVRIKHGDLVDVKCDGYLGNMLGRYIGKGYGVVELYDYAEGIKHVIGKVSSRGIDGNPRLISDIDLFDFIKD